MLTTIIADFILVDHSRAVDTRHIATSRDSRDARPTASDFGVYYTMIGTPPPLCIPYFSGRASCFGLWPLAGTYLLVCLFVQESRAAEDAGRIGHGKSMIFIS